MKTAKAHDKGCFCTECQHSRERLAKNAKATEQLGIKLRGKKADNPLRSCVDCKAPVYAGKAASHRPDLPIWAWQYDPEKVDWGIEYATDGGAPARCPRCRRKAA